MEENKLVLERIQLVEKNEWKLHSEARWMYWGIGRSRINKRAWKLNKSRGREHGQTEVEPFSTIRRGQCIPHISEHVPLLTTQIGQGSLRLTKQYTVKVSLGLVPKDISKSTQLRQPLLSFPNRMTL